MPTLKEQLISPAEIEVFEPSNHSLRHALLDSIKQHATFKNGVRNTALRLVLQDGLKVESIKTRNQVKSTANRAKEQDLIDLSPVIDSMEKTSL